MLLETLDLRTKDILIYSQNLFNFNDSFKIIYKNEKIRRPQRISYFDVCNFVKESAPKNLIIYRLLTNITNLDAYSTKYGYFIKINEKMELIYFDPIFAIKDLRHLRFELNPNHFRFKIQQVGLTSVTQWQSEPDFAEIFKFDLRAVEAQNQNDKIFADAIFAFDPNYNDGELEERIIEDEEEKVPRKSIAKPATAETTDATVSLSNIAEDKAPAVKVMNAPNPPNPNQVQELREEIISLLKQALNIDAELNSKIEKQPAKIEPEVKKESEERVKNVFDLFKSTNKSDGLTEREKESVILRFTK
ncbi:MAG: hypothetical protein RDU14_07095 [Melioribacteraceae bacterium]|nr:hypothetical protein [Melioribacteraceae bacterium]